MRNATKILTSAMMLAALAACGDKSADDAVTTPQAADSANTVAPPVPVSLIPVGAGITSLDVLQLAGAVPARTPCSLDKVAGQTATNQTITVAAGDNVLFQGWISNAAMQPPQVFALVLTGDNAYAFRGQPGVSRPDVARVLKADGMTKAGYNVHAKLDGIAPGEYSVSLIQEDEDNGTVVQCATTGKLMVAG